MELSQMDQEKLEVLHRASNTINRLPSNVTYPDRELQWLVVSGWNRGSIHCKFDRIQAASDFMTAAIDLGRHCPAVTDHMKVSFQTSSTMLSENWSLENSGSNAGFGFSRCFLNADDARYPGRCLRSPCKNKFYGGVTEPKYKGGRRMGDTQQQMQAPLHLPDSA